jgi:hypothetical protein
LSFLDERDEPPRGARPRRPPPRGPSTDPQTLLVRRLIAGGGGLLVVLLLFFGIKGCLASQKEQGFKDYVRDASELVGESEQQSAQLFDLLGNPGGSQVDFGSNVNGSKVQAEQLVDRAKGISVPDQLKSAQSALVETLELRRDGLGGIANAVSSAAGSDSGNVDDTIAAQMQFFLASDVIYSQRFLPRLLGTIDKEKLSQDVPVPDALRAQNAIKFLPDITWLLPATVAQKLGSIAAGGGASGPIEPGLHGTGLGSVTVNPAGLALTEGTAAQIPVSDDLSFDVEIANQGEHPEENVKVSVEISGGTGDPIQLEETLDAINNGETKVVSLPLADTPPTGEPVDIKVRIEPVPGEKKTDNNEATFRAIFSE